MTAPITHSLPLPYTASLANVLERTVAVRGHVEAFQALVIWADLTPQIEIDIRRATWDKSGEVCFDVSAESADIICDESECLELGIVAEVLI